MRSGWWISRLIKEKPPFDLNTLLALSLLIVLSGCPDWFTGPIGLEGPGTDASGQAELTTGDFPLVVPCNDRDTLPSDITFLAVITNSTQVIHIHDEYERDENLPAVCGLAEKDNTLESAEVGWDPDEGTDLNVCYTFAEALSSYFVTQETAGNNPGICRSSFGFTGDTQDGFPRAGIYRVDGCIEEGGNSYRVRIRLVITGDDVNKPLTEAGVADMEGLEVFNDAGTEVTTTEQAKELFTDNPDGFDFTIRSNDGAKTHLEVSVRLICVKHQVDACPEPAEPCS